MLDRVVVVGANGVVRWDRSWVEGGATGGPADIVTALITKVLIEERAAAYGGGGAGAVGSYSDERGATVRWIVERECGLVVAAVHQSALVLPYVEGLLRDVADAFAWTLLKMDVNARDGAYPCASFSPAFDSLVASAEERAAGEKQAQRKQKTFTESKKYDNTRKAQREEALEHGKKKPAAQVKKPATITLSQQQPAPAYQDQ